MYFDFMNGVNPRPDLERKENEQQNTSDNKN